jgi:LmbE family N-acetylglucosaminyl deacetylase
MSASLTFSGQRVCFIGAHPDDIELGAGALIAQIVDQTDIRCITLSDNQKNPDLVNIVEEHYASMTILGVPKEKVILGQFETRRFPQARQEILEYMIELNKSFNPDIVFVHTRADIHQDHGTVTEEDRKSVV